MKTRHEKRKYTTPCKVIARDTALERVDSTPALREGYTTDIVAAYLESRGEHHE